MGATARVAAVCALTLLTVPAWPADIPSEGMRPTEVKEGYRRVLGMVASSEFDQALLALMEFERQVVGDGEAWRRIDGFWRLKLRVLKDLLDSQPLELLMPVIVLHHDVYFLYSREGRRHLAHHSRQMASELAEIYAERAGRPAARNFSGWILTSFAVYLWSPSSIGESADLFHRAVVVDPGNEVAVLGMSAAYERHGDYAEAIEYLRRAVRIRPGDAEARLRLAMCRLRSERDLAEDVIAQLEALTGKSTSPWIRSVAYQELARTRLGSGDEEAAETLLREGLGQLPGDQQLSLQLASILDNQRRRDEAISVLNEISADGWEHESPRHRYDVWAPPALEAVRAGLHEEMKGGLVALRAGLLSASAEAAEE